MREYGDPSVIFSQRFQQTAELTVEISFSRAKSCKQPESPKNRRVSSLTARVRESSPDSGGSLPLAGYITAVPCIPQYPAPLLLACVISSDHISSYLILLSTRKKVKLQLRPGAFRVHRGSATSASFILCLSCPLSNLLFESGCFILCCCMKSCQRMLIYFFSPGITKPVTELGGLNICRWLVALVCLLMTTVWHRRTNFQVRRDHPKTLRTSLYLQLLLQSLFIWCRCFMLPLTKMTGLILETK